MGLGLVTASGLLTGFAKIPWRIDQWCVVFH